MISANGEDAEKIMKNFSTFINGATFWAIGFASVKSDVLIADTGINPGHEFADTFCTRIVGPEKLKTAAAESFYRYLKQHNALCGNRLHPAALIPAACAFILEHKINTLLNATMIDDSVNKMDNSHQITLMTSGGVRKLSAGCVIDTLIPAGNIRYKEFNAILHGVSHETIPEKWLNADEKDRMTPFISPGRFRSEAVLHFPCPADLEYIEARFELEKFWRARPAEIAEWTIALMAREFFEITGKTPTPGHEYFSKNFGDPLSALDAGAMEAMR